MSLRCSGDLFVSTSLDSLRLRSTVIPRRQFVVRQCDGSRSPRLNFYKIDRRVLKFPPAGFDRGFFRLAAA